MKPKLIITFLLIVLVPLAIMGWLGARVVRDQKEIVGARYEDLLKGTLIELDASISKVIKDLEREFRQTQELISDDPSTLRAYLRKEPRIKQVIQLDSEGRPIFPPREGELSAGEKSFYERTAEVWRTKALLQQLYDESIPPATVAQLGSDARTNIVDNLAVMNQPGPQRANDAGQSLLDRSENRVQIAQQSAQSINPRQIPNYVGAPRDYWWYIWYWGNGPNFIFLQRNGKDKIVGVELNRSRLLGDVIGALPITEPVDGEPATSRIVLRDFQGQSLYQWGTYEPEKKESPAATLALSPPLGFWKLEYYVPSALLETGGGGTEFQVAAAVLVLALLLAGLAVYFYRESTREIREARERITFVNQVSHELKTPLTNIQMYAELLRTRLPDEEDDKTAKQLDVVVSESQRLGRLIANILTFGRSQRNKLVLRRSLGKVDDAIGAVLEGFRPSLESKGVKIEFSPGASSIAEFDADIVGQILANLFGNVEKYAVSGGCLKIASSRSGGTIVVTVSDRGPGIPNSEKEKIFEPFYRISNRLTDGTAGSGIGLSIARDLARLHGGDITLMPSEIGATFRLVIAAPQPGNELD